MLILDIDGVISPPIISDKLRWEVASQGHEFVNHRCGAFQVEIASFVLDFLKATITPLAILSTWGLSASTVPQAFGFPAKIMVMDENLSGIQGKWDTVQKYRSAHPHEKILWADDHMTARMKYDAKLLGIETISPHTDIALTQDHITHIRSFFNISW